MDSIGAGMIFRLREQQLVKNNKDNQIQKYNFVQYVFFSKKIYMVYNGVWDTAPEAGEFSRIFVLKVTLQSVRLLLTVSYRKNGGRMYYLLPQLFWGFLCICDRVIISVVLS